MFLGFKVEPTLCTSNLVCNLIGVGSLKTLGRKEVAYIRTKKLLS